MKKQLLFSMLLFSFAGIAQLQLVEKLWINSSDTHSAIKNTAFYRMDSLYNDSLSTFNAQFIPDVLVGRNRFDYALRTGVGVLLAANVKDKLAIMVDYRAGYASAIPEAYTSSLQSKAMFHNEIGTGNYLYNNIKGRVRYTPSTNIEFQTGIDHLKIGEGDRSLLLGNQGVPNPFLSLKAKLWKFEYHFIQQLWREEKRLHSMVYSPKGSSSHYLSFKANKNFQIGVFESVVYDMKDTLYNRGFEVEYLNPLIFFRPQEYSLGSSDNVILGINTSFQWKKSMFYGQFVLDEFFLKEIKARSRWWANKYGVQIGYKTQFEKGQQQWFLRSEFNLMRPFTYSQNNKNAVYGNQGLPVAHSLGANFVEFYQEASLQVKKWEFTGFVQLYLKGIDSSQVSYSNGGDIYKPYTFRTPGQEYGYTIGSGVKTQVIQLGVYVARECWKRNVQVFVEPKLNWITAGGSQISYLFLTAGFHYKIGADRRNY